MKKFTIISIAAIAFALTSCDFNANRTAELEKELENLRNERHIADSLQNVFYDFLLEIEGNLTEIRTRERIVQDAARERPRNLQERIVQDLADISALMEQNRARLNDLERIRRQLRTANADVTRLTELIESLQARVEEQEEQIRELQEQLNIATQRIETLTAENVMITEESERRQAVIDQQTIDLNTGFYTIGTMQALRESGIITQRGGFIGIGRTNMINEEAAAQNFTRIDVREFIRLETNAQRIEIVTPHPAGSFRINNEDTRNLVIEITDPSTFWTSSRFLVVRTR